MPPLLYKYCSPCVLNNVLCDCTLKITPPNQFNDPFDCAPTFFYENGSPSAREFLEKFIREDYAKLSEIEKIVSPYDEFRKDSLLRNKDYDGKCSRPLSLGEKDSGMCLQNHRSKELRVLCLSEREDSNLMWSHYAKNHTGFVVGFDSKAEFLNRVSRKGDVPFHYECVSRVSYKKERPKSFPPQIDAELSQRSDIEAIFTKSEDWRYENEWRLVLPTSLVRSVNSELSLIDFPPIAVRKIIVGFRADECFKRQVVQLHKVKFPHAELLTVSLSPMNYDVETRVFHESAAT